ncbi:MAG: hypothetical protein JSS96_15485 [Bacteroidetes bacterium]|nr:hypothetical protein [Bacteroidota bacterium]
MNWKLIFQLSLFGLAMAVATISLIPSNIEPIFWLLIFLISAYVFAKQLNGKYFVHGFMLGLANCVWVTAAHMLFANPYMAHHHQEVAMMKATPMSNHPRVLMLITGPIVGVMSGLVIGLFSFIASKIVKSNTVVPQKG